MKVVYSSIPLLHGVISESINGQLVPANEVAERADLIRSALIADGGFQLVDPSEHGDAPILAVHDEGLLKFLAEAWPEARRQRHSAPHLIADTYPNRKMFEGMS